MTDDRAKDDGRERVCKAAMRLYALGGLEQVTMRTIGRELGVSSMMPYRHFASKDEIFVAIRSRVFGNFAAYLEGAVAGKDDPIQRYVAYCYAYLTFGRDASADYRFIFDLWPKRQYAIVLEREGRAALSRTLAFDLQVRIASDLSKPGTSAGDVTERAHIIWQSLHGLVALHAAKKLGFGLTINDLDTPTIRSILTGVFPELGFRGAIRRPALEAPVGLISPHPERESDETASVNVRQLPSRRRAARERAAEKR